jgi:hypothetical protein
MINVKAILLVMVALLFLAAIIALATGGQCISPPCILN